MQTGKYIASYILENPHLIRIILFFQVQLNGSNTISTIRTIRNDQHFYYNDIDNLEKSC